MNIIEKLSTFIVNLTYGDLTASSINHAKNCLVDTYGVGVLGSTQEDSKKFLASLQKYRQGKYAHAWGTDICLDPAATALINSFAGHVYDFDDNCNAGLAHLSVIIIPALIAVAEEEDKRAQENKENASEKSISGKGLITAFVIGWEVSARFGLALPKLYQEGWHCSSIFGTLGAAAACAKVLNLNYEETKNALALTLCAIAGLRECNGTKGKPFTLAKAAENAVTACYTAKAGIECSVNMLEGENGFFNVMANNVQDEAVFDFIAKPFVLDSLGVVVKKYPICSSALAAFEAMQTLQNMHDLKLEEIESIHCNTTNTVLKYLIYANPTSAAEAQFSLPYLLAVAFFDKTLEMKKHLNTDYIQKGNIQECMSKITYSGKDKVIDSEGKELDFLESAEVIIKTKDNNEYKLCIGEANGFPTSPFNREQFTNKFLDCTMEVIPKEKALNLLDKIYKLETIQTNISNLFEIE